MLNAWPDDGSVRFIESAEWTHQDTFAVASGLFGPRFALPIFPEGVTIGPSLQIQRRAWNEGDPVPDFAPYDFGTPLASQFVRNNDDPMLDLPANNVQCRWRLAWGIVDPRNTSFDDVWNFIHVRWRLCTFWDDNTLGPPDIRGDKEEAWWQFGINDRPPGFQRTDLATWFPAGYKDDDPSTHPGTPWQIADVPDATATPGVRVGDGTNHEAKTSLIYVWPRSDGGYPQGGIPGGRLDSYLTPRLNRGTLI